MTKWQINTSIWNVTNRSFSSASSALLDLSLWSFLFSLSQQKKIKNEKISKREERETHKRQNQQRLNETSLIRSHVHKSAQMQGAPPRTDVKHSSTFSTQTPRRRFTSYRFDETILPPELSAHIFHSCAVESTSYALAVQCDVQRSSSLWLIPDTCTMKGHFSVGIHWIHTLRHRCYLKMEWIYIFKNIIYQNVLICINHWNPENIIFLFKSKT